MQRNSNIVTNTIRSTIFFAIFCICLSMCCCQGSQNKTAVLEIISTDQKSKIYIKKKTWGVTSDYQVTVISGSPAEIVQLDSTADYVYKGLEPFVYKLQTDTLVIYTMQPAPFPNNFEASRIKIIQQCLSNSEYMKLIYRINKGDKELMKI